MLVGLLVFLLFVSYRSGRSAPLNAKTSPITSSSASYDYPSYSSGNRGIANEEDDEQLDEEETDDEETDRSSGSSRRRKGVIDVIGDAWEEVLYIPKRRKCPDCDGDATFDPQETGNGKCSECH